MRKLMRLKGLREIASIMVLLQIFLIFSTFIIPEKTYAATNNISETNFSTGTLTGVAGGANTLTLTNPGGPTFSRASTAYKDAGTSVASGLPRYENRAVNLIVNNSFETDSNADGLADNWINRIGGNSGGDAARVRTNSLSPALFNGTYSQKVQLVSTGNNEQDVIENKNFIPVEAGNTYTFSTYVKSNVANKVFLVIRLWDANITNSLAVDAYSSYLDVTNQTKRLTATITVPDGHVLAELHIRGINTAGEWMEMDAAQFEQSPVATPYVSSNCRFPSYLTVKFQKSVSVRSKYFQNCMQFWK